MKSGKIIALGLLALFPFAIKAQETQEIEKLNTRVDSLSQETTTLDKIVRKLSKFKVSAYIQGQFQYGQEDATLKVGDKNEHEDKGFQPFRHRRGRLKFEYDDGIGTGAVQFEANDKGVSFPRPLYRYQRSLDQTQPTDGGCLQPSFRPRNRLLDKWAGISRTRHHHPILSSRTNAT